MRLLKLLQIYEVDGITPKHQSEKFDFDNILGRTFRELKPTEVGAPMVLASLDREMPFKTTKVQAIDQYETDFRVLTRNTIYHFELSQERRTT
ncbi:hypothetical protein [Paenibacillus eucommiae]|uniref:UbiC transcription regulator-associated domain-containing protein n=1 Tax=Paenibacillus eucommiae TaxID=1355755 RepID=A0ABS4IRR2_9BACL|nr:hypothetical protein [Paenibacillus eucommiae]MBP1990257.1 hypothetical protein [Paenibacillus eucommiae]